jgi:hypothetical protein
MSFVCGAVVGDAVTESRAADAAAAAAAAAAFRAHGLPCARVWFTHLMEPDFSSRSTAIFPLVSHW